MTATAGSGAVWLVGAVATFAVGVLMAQQLGPHGYGVYGTVLALVALAGIPAQGGIPLLATRELAAARTNSDEERQRSVVRWAVTRVLATSLACALAAAAIATMCGRWIGYELAGTLAIGSVLLPVFALTTLVGAILRGSGRIVLGQAIDVLFRPATFMLALAMVWVEGQTLTPVLAIELQFVTTTLAVAVGAVAIRLLLPLGRYNPASRGDRRAWTGAALPMGATDGLRQVEGTYALLLLGLLATTGDVGLFRVALSSLAFVVLPISLQHLVTAPHFAAAFAERSTRRLAAIANGSAWFMTATVGMTTCGVLLLGEWALDVAFGAAFRGANEVLVLLSLGQLAGAIGGPGATLLSMANEERATSAIFLVSVTFAIFAAAVLIPLLGLSGAGWAALLHGVVRAFMLRAVTLRRLGVDPSIFGGQARTPATAS